MNQENQSNLTDHKFNTFLFDLDGTLLNTLPDLVLLTNKILRDEGYPERTVEEIRTFVGHGVRRLMYQALPEDADEIATERAMSRWNDNFQLYYHNTCPYPGIVDTLGALREAGCKIGAVSNKLQPGVDLILEKCVPGLIDVMFGEGGQDSRGRTMVRKPDPMGLYMAMEELGANPEMTLYVGDSPSDIITARNANLFSIAVTWGYHEVGDFAACGAEPDMMISAPAELLALVA